MVVTINTAGYDATAVSRLGCYRWYPAPTFDTRVRTGQAGLRRIHRWRARPLAEVRAAATARSAKSFSPNQRRTKPIEHTELSPELRVASFIEPVRAEGWRAFAMRVAGVLLIAGAILLVTAQYVPYADLGGKTVTAPVSVLSIVAQIVLLAVLLTAGGLLAAGRGGRAAMAMSMAFGISAVGSALLVIFETTDRPSHPSTDYYFGQGYDTASIVGRAGHSLALIAEIALIVAGILCVACWNGTVEDDPVPLEGARVGVAVASVGAGIIGFIAFFNPPVFPAVRVSKPDGIMEVPVEIQVPVGPTDALGLGRVGGLTFTVTILVLGVLIALLTSRKSVIGALIGLSGFFAYQTLLNLRDVAGTTDFVAGVRTYLLIAATVVVIVGTVYAIVARRRRSGPFGAETDES